MNIPRLVRQRLCTKLHRAHQNLRAHVEIIEVIFSHPTSFRSSQLIHSDSRPWLTMNKLCKERRTLRSAAVAIRLLRRPSTTVPSSNTTIRVFRFSKIIDGFWRKYYPLIATLSPLFHGAREPYRVDTSANQFLLSLALQKYRSW